MALSAIKRQGWHLITASLQSFKANSPPPETQKLLIECNHLSRPVENLVCGALEHLYFYYYVLATLCQLSMPGCLSGCWTLLPPSIITFQIKSRGLVTPS